MSNRVNSYFLVLVFCQIVVLSAACTANAKRDAPLNSLQHDASRDVQSDPGTDSVRFIVEHSKAPEPGVRGNVVDAEYAWVIGMTSGYLLRTVDGGKTWEALHPISQDVARFGRMQDMYVRSFFISGTRGWLMANSGTWQTEDGGLTWRRILADGFDDIQFMDLRHGWMGVGIDVDNHQQSYVTADGGENWKPCGTPRVYTDHVPTRAYFLTPQTGWAITTKSDKKDIRVLTRAVAQSTDGGCSWNQRWTAFDQDAKYYDIYFVNEREGWLGGEQSLLYTRDGGRSWSEVPRPQTDANVVSVFFLNSQEGWIIGGYSFMQAGDTGVFRTTDAGKNWRQLSKLEVINGFEQQGRLVQLPQQWKAGKLRQLLYRSRLGNEAQ